MKRLCCEPRILCPWMELVYRQISLIYIRALACSLFWTLTFLIGLLVCGRGSSNWGITKNLWWSDILAGFSHHTSRGPVFQFLKSLTSATISPVITTIITMRQNQWFANWEKNLLGTNWFQSPQGSTYFCDFTTDLWNVSTLRKCFIVPPP